MHHIFDEVLRATASLEDRVTRLEALLANVATAARKAKKKNWRRTLGMFTGDEVMKRIDEQALKYRDADRKKVQRPRGRTHLAKP
jgi:hypothetical protein